MLEILKKALALLALLVPRVLRHRDEKRRERERNAFAQGDREEANRALDRLLKVAAVAFVALSLCGGCHTYTVVAADEEILPMVHEDVEGWFVPTSTMLRIYEKLNEAKENE